MLRIHIYIVHVHTYLLLTEFEVCTVSYRPSFFPFDLWARIEGENQWSVSHSTDQEDEASKIFVNNISPVCPMGLGNHSKSLDGTATNM